MNRENRDLLLQFGAVAELRRNWVWFVILGIILILLGCVAIGAATYTTFFTVAFLGALLAISGIIEIVHAFWTRKWSGFFLALLTGILYLVVGGLLLIHPAASAVTLTLLIALLLMVSGIFRLLSSIILRFEHWGWVFFSGLVSLLLGIFIASGWPLTGFWVIGLFVGVDLILYGWSWVISALVARQIKI